MHRHCEYFTHYCIEKVTTRTMGDFSVASPRHYNMDSSTETKRCNNLKVPRCILSYQMMYFSCILISYISSSFICIVPYPPNSEFELELNVGDIVFVHKKRDNGWFKGSLARTGKIGLFPASFVQPHNWKFWIYFFLYFLTFF